MADNPFQEDLFSEDYLTVGAHDLLPHELVTVDGDMLTDDAVQSNHIQDGAVTNPKIDTDAVQTDNIADFAVVAKKMNTQSHILF